MKHAKEHVVECVFLTCFEGDFSYFSNVLWYSDIRMHHAKTLDEADFLLTVTGSSVLLSDIVFPEATWRDVLQMAVHLHPLVASLIVADPVDQSFVEDAISHGACGLLWKPIQLNPASRLIRAAHEATFQRVTRQKNVLAA